MLNKKGLAYTGYLVVTTIKNFEKFILELLDSYLLHTHTPFINGTTTFRTRTLSITTLNIAAFIVMPP